MPFDPRLLVRHSEVARASASTASFYRSVRAGKFVHLAHGTYLPAAEWRELSGDERFLARIHAFAASSRRPPVFSHFAAAALWRLPAVTGWPARADILADQTGRGTRKGPWHREHAVPLPDELVSIDGLLVTPLARTLIDISRAAPLSGALAMVDAALAPLDTWNEASARVSVEELAEEFAPVDSLRARGRAKCALVLELADGGSRSPGESVSRAGMHVLGVPRPELQREFRDRQGRMFTDFWWPEFEVAGEFDGEGKYLKPELRRPGESVADAVIREKNREDRIRVFTRGFARWDWPVAWSLPELAARLRDAGVRW
jgi:hypothetical protein